MLASRVRFGTRFCATLVLCAMLSPFCITTAGAQASVSVQGHVEQYDGPSRLRRPPRHDLPAGKPNLSGHKKGLSLSTGTTGSILSPHKFKFGVADAASPARPLRLPGGAAENVDQSQELVLAWDEWHKRVIEAFYERWKTGTDVSGQAKVTVIVSREGEIECSCDDFEQPSFGEFNSCAEDAFKHAVRHAIMAVAKTATLDFPEQSQRDEVKIVTTFSMNMEGLSGYSYKRGDTERVRVPASKGNDTSKTGNQSFNLGKDLIKAAEKVKEAGSSVPGKTAKTAGKN